MKMFKKLMAVALAGVLALTVLTGCGSSVDRKEFVRFLNDYTKALTGAMFGASENIELSDAGKEQADKVIALVQTAYDKTAEEEKADFDPLYAISDKNVTLENNTFPEVKKALGITEDTKDAYAFSIVEVGKNTSEYNKKYATSQLAQKAMDSRIELNEGENVGNKGTVSFDTVTLGDTEYLVVVVKIAA